MAEQAIASGFAVIAAVVLLRFHCSAKRDHPGARWTDGGLGQLAMRLTLAAFVLLIVGGFGGVVTLLRFLAG